MEGLPAIGTLTDRIQLKRLEILPDHQKIYVPVSTMWARVRAVTSDGITHRVAIRYRTDVDAGDRLIYRGRQLEAVDVSDLDGRRAYLLIDAREVQP